MIQSVIVKKRLLLLGLALAGSPGGRCAERNRRIIFRRCERARLGVVLRQRHACTQRLAGSSRRRSALLKLKRGGEVRICPRTNLSLSSDPSGKALVLGLNAGAMELDYALHSAADSLITPDFRLQLISPGTFHLAISVTPTGDTCLHSLPGNDAALFIAEMMGNGLLSALAGKKRDVPGGKDLWGDGGSGGMRLSRARSHRRHWRLRRLRQRLRRRRKGQFRRTRTLEAAQTQTKPEPNANQSTSQSASPAHLEVNSSFVYRGDAGGAGLLLLGVAAIAFDRQLGTGPGAASPGQRASGGIHSRPRRKQECCTALVAFLDTCLRSRRRNRGINSYTASLLLLGLGVVNSSLPMF